MMMYRALTFEYKVSQIKEILKAYRPEDANLRQELVEMIYAAFSGWVAQWAWASASSEDTAETIDGFWIEEMISNFWVWFCCDCPFERYDPTGPFTSWFKACCRRRFAVYIARRRRSSSIPEMPFSADALDVFLRLKSRPKSYKLLQESSPWMLLLVFSDKNTIKDIPWIYNYLLTGNLG